MICLGLGLCLAVGSRRRALLPEIDAIHRELAELVGLLRDLGVHHRLALS